MLSSLFLQSVAETLYQQNELQECFVSLFVLRINNKGLNMYNEYSFLSGLCHCLDSFSDISI